MEQISMRQAKLDYIKQSYKDVIYSLTQKLKDIESGEDYCVCGSDYDLNTEFKKAHNISMAEINIDGDDSDQNSSCYRCQIRRFQQAQGIYKTRMINYLTGELSDRPHYYKIKEQKK